MKICITAQGNTIDALVDPRFGRCRYFILMDTETGVFEAVENPALSAGGGAGIQSAQLVADKGVTVVLTGNVGPNAFQTLQAAGVAITTGVQGTVADAIDAFKNNEFSKTDKPSVDSHFGMS